MRTISVNEASAVSGGNARVAIAVFVATWIGERSLDAFWAFIKESARSNGATDPIISPEDANGGSLQAYDPYEEIHDWMDGMVNRYTKPPGTFEYQNSF